MNEEQKKDGMYDDLPMPRVAAVVGWLVACAICLGLVSIGRGVAHLIMGNGFVFKVSIFNVVLSLVVGTYVFFKTKRKNT